MFLGGKEELTSFTLKLEINICELLGKKKCVFLNQQDGIHLDWVVLNEIVLNPVR